MLKWQKKRTSNSSPKLFRCSFFPLTGTRACTYSVHVHYKLLNCLCQQFFKNVYCSTNTARVPICQNLTERGSRAMIFSPIELLSFVIEQICQNRKSYVKNPDTDFKRERKLPLKDLLMLLIRIEGNCMNAEIAKAFPDINQQMHASAVIQQRDKLKPEVFLQILRLFNQYIPVKRRWHKYRVLALDGSKYQVPLNRKGIYFFGPNGRDKLTGEKAKDISMVVFHGLFDVLNRMFLDVRLSPAKGKGNDERTAAIDILHNNALNDAIITMDRGYDGYNMFEHANRFGGHYVIRCQNSSNAIPEIRDLPNVEMDKWVHMKVTTSTKKKFKNSGYRHIRAPKKDYGKDLSEKTKYQRWDFEETCIIRTRIIKFQLDNGTWEVLATNLRKDEFSIKDLKELYHLRWGIETAYRDLKYTIGSKCCHSRKDQFIEQELLAHTVMYNIISTLVDQITIEAKPGEKHPKKVDFKMATVAVREFLFHPGRQTYEELLMIIKKHVHSVVSGRRDERKIRPPTLIPFTYRISA